MKCDLLLMLAIGASIVKIQFREVDREYSQLHTDAQVMLLQMASFRGELILCIFLSLLYSRYNTHMYMRYIQL